MSGKISGLIWDLDIPHAEAWVLMAMADHADHEGYNVFPSVGLIAWKTCYSERQVQRIIKSLRTKRILIPMEEAAGHVVKYRIVLTGVPLKAPRKKPKDPRQDVTPDKMSPLTPSHEGGDIAMSEGGDIKMSPEPSVKRQASGGVAKPSQTTPPPQGQRESDEALKQYGYDAGQRRKIYAARLPLTDQEIADLPEYIAALKRAGKRNPIGIVYNELIDGKSIPHPEDVAPTEAPLEYIYTDDGRAIPKDPERHARIQAQRKAQLAAAGYR
jgi:hypothetical protein